MKKSPCEGIPFGAIISIINRSRFVFLNNRLEPLGLTSGQFPVLMLLYKEQNITQETLVRHFHLDKGTIARAVKKLKNAGYIQQIPDPENRRAVRLFLTEKGKAAAPVLQAIDREWESTICTDISKPEKVLIKSLMLTVAKNSVITLNKSGDFTDAGK